LLDRLLEDLSDTSRRVVEAKYGVGPYEEPLTVETPSPRSIDESARRFGSCANREQGIEPRQETD